MTAEIIRQRNALLDGTQTPIEIQEEQKVRPKTLTDYVGQSQLKETLSISLKAAQQRQEPLDHVLLYGPPGLGKTTMAMVLAHEMNAQLTVTSAPALERPRDIVGLMMNLKTGDVLFIDEIHRLNKVTEEILYSAMEDFVMDRTVGKGPTAKTLRVPLPKFTLIGATTKAGSIASPLRDRFGMAYRLNFYTDDELVSIIQRSAGVLEIAATLEGAQAMAKRSRGTPRIANRLLKRVRDYVQVCHQPDQTEEPVIDQTAAELAMDLYEIDRLGLDATDRRLLQVMIEQFAGGPVGIESLAAALGEDVKTLEDVYEPYLLQNGLIQRTPRGRQVAQKAINHLLESAVIKPDEIEQLTWEPL